jgi:PPOX class probable F420-dependent enzyme
MLDLTTETGAAAAERLERELVIWLTTVRPDGQPQTSAVWFQWRAGEILLYSLDRTARVTNIEANPKVALNLNSDPEADNVLTIEGEARIDRSAGPPSSVPAWIAKYRHLIEAYDWTIDDYAARYPLAIRIRPTRFRFG